MRLLHRHDQEAFTGGAGRRYDRLAARLNRPLFHRVGELAAAVAPWQGAVLDAGTGSGHLVLELARVRPDLDVHGLDLSDDMVAIGREHIRDHGPAGKVTLEAGDVTALPYPDDRFDLVVSTYSMHHWPDVPAAVREFGRVLRPGGHLWIFDGRFARADALVDAMRDTFPRRTLRRTRVWAPLPLTVGYGV